MPFLPNRYEAPAIASTHLPLTRDRDAPALAAPRDQLVPYLSSALLYAPPLFSRVEAAVARR